MAYVKQEWKDGKEGNTPISAKRLNHIEDGIAEKAKQGEPGKQGKPGKNGKDMTYEDMSDENINDLAAKVADKLKSDNNFIEDVADAVAMDGDDDGESENGE